MRLPTRAALLSSMLERLKALMDGTLLLVEVRALRTDLAALTNATTRIAAALERRNEVDYPIRTSGAAVDLPPVDVTFVHDTEQAEWMDIELRLTQARGAPPSEEEMLEEYMRRRAVETQGERISPP